MASADNYRAGEFTVTLSQDANNGRIYRGCDAKSKCINLNHGTAWQDNGYRGVTWENGAYTYSISWAKGASSLIYLNVYKNNTPILRRQLVPIP